MKLKEKMEIAVDVGQLIWYKRDAVIIKGIEFAGLFFNKLFHHTNNREGIWADRLETKQDFCMLLNALNT